MSSKAPDAAGWVVEVVILAPGNGSPSNKYFNVAIPDVASATDAVWKLPLAAKANRVEAVRKLSAEEMAALRLKAGKVKPA
jgi:hypothetical protein